MTPASSMRTRRFGRTDAEVSVVGLGAMYLSLPARPNRERAIEVVHRALDMGVTLIDTSDAYCRDHTEMHHNESLVHEALDTYQSASDDVFVATKGGCVRPNGQWEARGDPEYLRRTIRDSYEALGGDRPIDLWQHHLPDSRVPVEESLQAAADAVDEGLIRSIGVSNYTREQLERANDVVDVMSVQNQYNPWHRQPERNGVLKYCKTEDIVFIPWSPLGGGPANFGRAKELSTRSGFTEIAAEKQISPYRLTIAWLLHRSPAILPIPGTTNPEHAEDSLSAYQVTLSDEEVARLDGAA